MTRLLDMSKIYDYENLIGWLICKFILSLIGPGSAKDGRAVSKAGRCLDGWFLRAVTLPSP